MKPTDAFLSWIGFACLALAVLVGPWFFGAWEMWWFWLFAFFIFTASFAFGVRLLLFPQAWTVGLSENGKRLRIMGVISFAPFFVYALVRLFTAGVLVDAERSFLLFLTPFLVGIQIVMGFSRRQARLIYVLLFADLCLLGAYGVLNHLVTGSKWVLWAPGYPQYLADQRATGSYFCPDHFSGIMELGVCLGLGRLLVRNSRLSWRLAGACLVGIGVTGVVLSKSRGGGLTLLVIGFAALVWGFSQWPPFKRWCYRISAVSLAALLLVLLFQSEGGYTRRFGQYFGWSDARSKPWPEMRETVVRRLTDSARGQMIAAALRAWQSQPVLGIGPGMHQHLWPHIAATPDGDRESGLWPSKLNNAWHSYEVHSDWVQLLEEYGLIGFGLFLLPLSAVWHILRVGYRREIDGRRANGWRRTGRGYHALVLGALLAVVGMVFHSLGDFNLQMPATTWLLAVIVAVPMQLITSRPGKATVA